MPDNLKGSLNNVLTYATRYRRVTLALHTIMVAAGCVVLFTSWRAMESQRLQLEFETICDRVVCQVTANLNEHHQVVESIASFHAGNPDFTKDEFRRFVARSIRQYPNIRALEWAPLVDASGRQRIERTVGVEGLSDFRIRNSADKPPSQSTTDDWEDASFPVLYTQPSSVRPGTTGIDLGSHPIHRMALEQAAKSGLPVSTPDFLLPHSVGSETCFRLVVPVYHEGTADTIRHQPPQSLEGFASGVFQIRAILGDSLDSSYKHPYHLTVTEPSGSFLYRSSIPAQATDRPINESAGYTHMAIYNFGGRQWTLNFRSKDQWVESRQGSIGLPIFAGGTTLAILLGSVLWTFTERTAHIEGIVSHRTQELKTANEFIREQRDRLRSGQLILKESNQQLKEFAYAASHDLQTPLRGMANYAQFLKEDYSSIFDETGTQYLNGIISSANRMKQLISQLLEYSQLESQKDLMQLTDLNTVMADVLLLLQTEIDSAKAIVNCDVLPTIVCDPKQMAQLFRNLLTNSLKYRSEESPRIHISVDEASDLAISVTDNGIGIASEFQSRIFEIFRRLHTQAEYPGTGIGLALCRRIAQRHGGAISVDSALGKGCRFTLTIPAQNATTRTYNPRDFSARSTRLPPSVHFSLDPQAEPNCQRLAAHS